jgi:hypothetical protein
MLMQMQCNYGAKHLRCYTICWCDVRWPCFVLCASVLSRMGGVCAQICVERGLGGLVAITPITIRGMGVVVVE